MTTYRALKALKYPVNPRASRDKWQWKHVAAGEVVDDIPAKSRPWLLKRGAIEPVDGTAAPGEADDGGEES